MKASGEAFMHRTLTVDCEFTCRIHGSEIPLVERFNENLIVQHKEKASEKMEKVADAKKDLESLLSLGVDFRDLVTKWKTYDSATKIKSDRECTGSSWTIGMLESYIKRQDIEFIPPGVRNLNNESFLKIYERVLLSIEAMRGGGEGNVENLSQLGYHTAESDIRKIVDAIFDPLCVYNGLTIRTEQTLKCDLLPTNRCDYIMYYQNQPIGVVEAKRQESLKDQSVAQLLVQLFLLSAEAPNLFYFGVLSDAYQFIFAGVTTNKFVFFQRNDDALEITTIKSPQDLKSVVDKISWLIDIAIQSRETANKSIEEILNPVMASLNLSGYSS
ncbi:hypothetical protein OS493_027660 [Desmophyllum pertusum]|uniref:Uncharacterized protein n=1 Tax=Desmophyllum pertusum TaxID=174260 RepID=A0A9W9ZL18_9CNID|nr:hypothetical protein OS493_027660 [Desmophyllum pertusum]